MTTVFSYNHTVTSLIEPQFFDLITHFCLCGVVAKPILL